MKDTKELAAVCEPTSLADFARAGTDGAPLAGTADWQAVTIDAPLLKDGHIAGIEFYPGFFGKENEWVAGVIGTIAPRRAFPNASKTLASCEKVP